MVEKKVFVSDSVESNRVSYLKALAQTYEVQKIQRSGRMVWQTPGYQKNFGKTDLYNSGYSFFKGVISALPLMFSIVTLRVSWTFWILYGRKGKVALDSTGALGLAIPHYQKVVEIGEQETDKEKVKTNYLALKASTSSNISTMYKRTRLRLYSL